MLQLKNNTPFATQMTFFPNENGIDTLYIVVKTTFNVGNKWTVVDEQPEVQLQDVYWGEPVESSIRYPSDIHTGKPTTDIIMLGHAIAPNLKPVTELDVSLSVAKNTKTVRVIGDRIWKNKNMSTSKPFKSMAMVYENSYGGSHSVDGVVQSSEPKNTVGRGFIGKRSAKEMDNLSLPNIEDPRNLISSIKDKPVPACFASSAPNWLPRVDYAGTYDDDWLQNRVPYLPTDFDSRFFNVAHPDMITKTYLQGGEPVTIHNMNEQSHLKFNLPTLKLSNLISVEDRVETAKFNMETLILEPTVNQLSMVWRATMLCDKKTLAIDEVTISMSR